MVSLESVHVPDQSGRTVVVTGADSGLGFETAKRLAAAGAHVVLACRNEQKAQDAAARIEGSTEVRRLDVSSLDSVRAFESALKKQGTPVEIKIYDGAGHAFANPSGGSYRPDAAKDAWQRTTAFLARTLKK